MKTITLLLLPLFAFCQVKQAEIFYCDEVLRDLRTAGTTSKYFEKLDYESMLLLDKAYFPDLLRVNPGFLLEKSIDTALLFSSIPDHAKSKIKTSESNLGDFILSRNNKDGQFMNVSGIYIKDNRMAVYESSNGSTSSKYRLTKHGGFVEVELIYTIIE
jgi:hypothetical protein